MSANQSIGESYSTCSRIETRPRPLERPDGSAGHASMPSRSGRLGREHLRRGDELADVPLRVFRGVEKKAEHGGGELAATDAAGVKKRRLTRCAELLERLFDCMIESGDELAIHSWGEVRRLFTGERLPLSVREAFAPGVREQPVEASPRVTDMESDGRGVAWTRPYLLGRESCDVRRHFFPTLEQAVSDRLQPRGNRRQRSAKPHFRLRQG